MPHKVQPRPHSTGRMAVPSRSAAPRSALTTPTFALEQRQHQQMAREQRLCLDYSKSDRLLRGMQEFELANARRLVSRRKAEEGKGVRERARPWYTTGNSLYAQRPPTNVDMALGLNGFQHSAAANQARGKGERVPSTLKPLEEKQPYQMPLRPTPESEKEKWDSIRREVEHTRSRQEEERRAAVAAAEERRAEESSQMMREERTRQLDRAVVSDWDYQVRFKEAQAAKERTAEAAEAMANLHVNEGEMRQEEEANRRREAFWREAKRDDLEGHASARRQEAAAKARGEEKEFVECSRGAREEREEREEEEEERRRKGVAVGEQQRRQISEQRFRQRREEERAFKEKEELNVKNQALLSATAAHASSSERRLGDSRQNFEQEHLRQLEARKATEARYENVFAKEEARNWREQIRHRGESEAADRLRRGHEQGDGVAAQIASRRRAEEAEAARREREQEDRLREEEIYASELRASREAEAGRRRDYAEFLLGQGRERREREEEERREEDRRRDNKTREQNARDKEDRRRTARINMMESHFVLA